jgi:uncharacterized protein (TIGR00661 family)
MIALDMDIPKEYSKGALLAKTATKLSAPMATKYIILSFVKNKTAHKNMRLVSPILRKEILKLKPRKANKIIVYQPAINENLLRILGEIPEKFIVYTYKPEKTLSRNTIMKRISRDFIKELASAKAVIGTAGFSLISESLYLKKPYFAIPLRGQFEQMVNALFIQKEGFGMFSENPKKEQILEFLGNLANYEKNLKKHKINPKEALLVLKDILESIEASKRRQNQ